MEPRINVITLAVEDLARALAFYRDGLGLQSPGVVATEYKEDENTAAGAVVMFELQGGSILALYPRRQLAKDAGITVPQPGSGLFSIGQIVGSRSDVDKVLERAGRAGATVTDRPRERPWGIYSGYFRDPDGHLWEIIFNPHSLT